MNIFSVSLNVFPPNVTAVNAVIRILAMQLCEVSFQFSTKNSLEVNLPTHHLVFLGASVVKLNLRI